MIDVMHCILLQELWKYQVILKGWVLMEVIKIFTIIVKVKGLFIRNVCFFLLVTNVTGKQKYKIYVFH